MGERSYSVEDFFWSVYKPLKRNRAESAKGMRLTAFSLCSKRSSWELEAVPFPTTLHWHDLIESRGQWILQNATCKAHSRYSSFIRAWLNQPTDGLPQSTLGRVLHFEIQPCLDEVREKRCHGRGMPDEHGAPRLLRAALHMEVALRRTGTWWALKPPF